LEETMLKRSLLAAFGAALICSCHAAVAQTSEDVFFKGKTITCYIGYGPGGGYDTFARIISKHMTRHIPGEPGIVPVNMPGASSMTLAYYIT
jgi:tripartite-type tricarboxylate transporter receptor subunit TctC